MAALQNLQRTTTTHIFDVATGLRRRRILATLLFMSEGCQRRQSHDHGGGGSGVLVRCRKASCWRIFRRRWPAGRAEKKLLREAFADELTMRDTVKPVLILTRPRVPRTLCVPHADALEMDGYDFKLRDVRRDDGREAVGAKVSDGRTRIVAINGRVAMNNLTAAAITHVLNNKQEFLFCNGPEDLLVLSLGNGGRILKTRAGQGSLGSLKMELRRYVFIRVRFCSFLIYS
ncbi:patatin-like protein 6 [Eucalyptus grandis]|uniref:patatin-like protein 6 n=1 Tax=Eucalyptus grandis TaxID=71139 RepID=UPI00192EABAC|nr:patatin-like protein 6 [Eucalyptus grandis]